MAAASGINDDQDRSRRDKPGQKGVIAESSPNCTLSGIEECCARISEGPEVLLERLCRPNIVAIEGDVPQPSGAM
jgi:hypothetical protein